MTITKRSTGVLIDTSFLLAAMFVKDARHREARDALREIKTLRVVPAPVVYELFRMTTVRIHYERAIQIFVLLQSKSFQIQDINDLDMQRMTEIMRQYQDKAFDLADTAIMALSERLNITQVYTFDRRDFQVFRPKHSDYLELLP